MHVSPHYDEQTSAPAQRARMRAHARPRTNEHLPPLRLPTFQVLWGGTLFHPDDLPFQLSAMPVSYGEFRDRVAGIVKGPKGQAKRAGSGTAVRKPLAAPDTLKGMPAGRSAIGPCGKGPLKEGPFCCLLCGLCALATSSLIVHAVHHDGRGLYSMAQGVRARQLL